MSHLLRTVGVYVRQLWILIMVHSPYVFIILPDAMLFVYLSNNDAIRGR